VWIVINIQVEKVLRGGKWNETLDDLVYYNQLPMNINQIQQSIEHREDFIKFGRDFEPIR
jgi:hypothetical protein